MPVWRTQSPIPMSEEARRRGERRDRASFLWPTAASTVFRPSVSAKPTTIPLPTLPRVVAKDDPQHVAALGAQSHSNAKLVRPLRHGVGDHAVEPDRGQRQGQTAKYAEDPRRQVLLLPLLPIGDPGVQIFDVAVALLFRVHRRQIASVPRVAG